MQKIVELETEECYLRAWREEDFAPYAKLTSDREVMKFFPKILTPQESRTAALKFQRLLSTRGWGFWAVEEKKSGKFIGYAGLHSPSTIFPFSPCVEIAWRIEEQYWKSGVVLELGKVILNHALTVLKLEEIVYFSSVDNERAKGVVEALGMVNQEQNFSHPFVPKEHRLSEHYLYKIKN